MLFCTVMINSCWPIILGAEARMVLASMCSLGWEEMYWFQAASRSSSENDADRFGLLTLLTAAGESVGLCAPWRMEMRGGIFIAGPAAGRGIAGAAGMVLKLAPGAGGV